MELRVSPEQLYGGDTGRWPLAQLYLQGWLWMSHCLAVLMGGRGVRLAMPFMTPRSGRWQVGHVH